jgi:hypothetical protein
MMVFLVVLVNHDLEKLIVLLKIIFQTIKCLADFAVNKNYYEILRID